MIVVTGATGKLGRLIVRHLLARVPADELAISVRNVSKAQEFADRGIRVRQGDFENPDTLDRAFEGARQVMIVSSNASAYGGDPESQHLEAIDAAKRVGARRIVYTSHMAASRSSAFLPMKAHMTTEDMLAESGLAWTALRNGFYAASARQFTAHAIEAGAVVAPRDGKFSWTAHEDLAEAAARILAAEGWFNGPTPPLTGPEALDFYDVSRILAELSGRPVERTIVSDEAFSERLERSQLPQSIVDITLSMYRAARAGEFVETDPALKSILGREPTSLRHVLAAPQNGE